MTTTLNGHAPNGATTPFEVHHAAGWPLHPDKGRHRTRRVTAAVTSHRGWLAAVPIVLVNAVAFCGQLAFLRAHLPWPLAGQILVAVTLESVAVYLAWQAHLALAAGDSAFRMRLAAYGFALVIGAMNYSHWMAPGWRPTFAAVTFALMSVSSPWLWSVHSRRVSRDALLAAGDLEPHAVRLGMTRWTWHPVRSARVMWLATWEGECNPRAAIALLPAAATVTGDMTDDRARSGQPGKNGGDGTGLAGSTCVQVAAVTAPVATGDSDDGRPPPRSDKPPATAKAELEAAAAAEGVSVRTIQRRRAKEKGSAT